MKPGILTDRYRLVGHGDRHQRCVTIRSIDRPGQWSRWGGGGLKIWFIRLCGECLENADILISTGVVFSGTANQRRIEYNCSGILSGVGGMAIVCSTRGTQKRGGHAAAIFDRA